MKKQEEGGLRWHPGITMHKIPVVGAGGLIFAVGIVVLALLGLPIAKWFLIGAVIWVLGLLAFSNYFESCTRKPRWKESSLMLGVKATTVIGDTVQRKSLGAEHWVGNNSSPPRRVSERRLARMIFDN